MININRSILPAAFLDAHICEYLWHPAALAPAKTIMQCKSVVVAEWSLGGSGGEGGGGGAGGRAGGGEGWGGGGGGGTGGRGTTVIL